MYEGRAEGRGIDAGAVLSGMAAGLITLLGAGLILSLAAWQVPMTPGAWGGSVWGVQGLAGLLAGLWSGRRAAGAGLLHGLLAGATLALALVAVASVVGELPPMRELLLRGAALGGVGALGGIVGVNAAR